MLTPERATELLLPLFNDAVAMACNPARGNLDQRLGGRGRMLDFDGAKQRAVVVVAIGDDIATLVKDTIAQLTSMIARDNPSAIMTDISKSTPHADL